jgi:hypothetical protein
VGSKNASCRCRAYHQQSRQLLNLWYERKETIKSEAVPDQITLIGVMDSKTESAETFLLCSPGGEDLDTDLKAIVINPGWCIPEGPNSECGERH